MSGTGPCGREARREQAVKRVRNPGGGTDRGWNPGNRGPSSSCRCRGAEPHEGRRSRAGLRRERSCAPWRGAQAYESLRRLGVGQRLSGRPRGRGNGEAGAGNRIPATEFRGCSGRWGNPMRAEGRAATSDPASVPLKPWRGEQDRSF